MNSQRRTGEALYNPTHLTRLQNTIHNAKKTTRWSKITMYSGTHHCTSLTKNIPSASTYSPWGSLLGKQAEAFGGEQMHPLSPTQGAPKDVGSPPEVMGQLRPLYWGLRWWPCCSCSRDTIMSLYTHSAPSLTPSARAKILKYWAGCDNHDIRKVLGIRNNSRYHFLIIYHVKY